MTKKDVSDRRFYKAKQEVDFAERQLSTPQTQSKSYRLAFQDTEFLLREELRPVRFQLELLKPEMLLDEAGVASTIVIYGSARIPEPEKAQLLVEAATDDRSKIIAQRLMDKSRFYEQSRRLAQLASTCGIKDDDGNRHFVVCSGGGPSIMEAANRGAHDVGAESVGLNIVLPHEQAPNIYVTPGLSFQFHYFALRKMHFLLRARAVAVFPGGFGTFDEFFELLTLIQTGKIARMPILLFGREFWERVVNFEELMLEGVISPPDLDLFKFVESAEEAWAEIYAFYDLEPC
ncbi:MAG: LOG family protein [Sphingorhabdus sp.]